MGYPVHFLMSEFLYSDTALRMGIENFPTWQAAENLRRLAGTMDRVRSLLDDMSIMITSGFRCPALNAAVGGVADSAHLDGLASDFVCESFGTPTEICKALEPHLMALDIDQLIDDGSWVHLGLAAEGCIARNQCFAA